jgi:hypothetical protein
MNSPIAWLTAVALIAPAMSYAQLSTTEDCGSLYCGADSIHQVTPAQVFVQGVFQDPTGSHKLLLLADFGFAALSSEDGEVTALDSVAYHARHSCGEHCASGKASGSDT